jgi:hypothetical protein
VLSGLTVLLLGLALAQAGTPPAWVLAACLSYGACGPALSIQSQALWQQTGVSLALALALLQRPWALAAAGALAAAVRAPDVLMLVPFALAAPRLTRPLAAGVALGAAVFALNNWLAFGSPFITGYSLALNGRSGFTPGELPESLAGLLLSPAHGLLVYAPWVVFALRAREPLARAALASAGVLFALISVWWSWWGGDAFGPRILAEAMVPLAFALGRAGPALSRAGRVALAALALVGLLTHASYVFWLAGAPGYSPGGAWTAAAHPLGYALHR